MMKAGINENLSVHPDEEEVISGRKMINTLGFSCHSENIMEV